MQKWMNHQKKSKNQKIKNGGNRKGCVSVCVRVHGVYVHLCAWRAYVNACVLVCMYMWTHECMRACGYVSHYVKHRVLTILMFASCVWSEIKSTMVLIFCIASGPLVSSSSTYDCVVLSRSSSAHALLISPNCAARSADTREPEWQKKKINVSLCAYEWVYVYLCNFTCVRVCNVTWALKVKNTYNVSLCAYVCS